MADQLPPPAVFTSPPGQEKIYPRTGYYSADQMRAYAKATRALALEEAIRECDKEAQDYAVAWSRQAITAVNLCAESIRALIGKEQP